MSFGNPFSAGYENSFGALGLGFNGFEVSLNFVSGVPDPNVISDSSLKLIFKSLLKRDETTKEKALNELASFTTSDNISILKDDLVLITWIQLYPKLSISENKSVRSLSHHIQCKLISILQKSYLKYLKDSLPILLSGLYDIDSSVSNLTLKYLSEVFNKDQTKINNLWVLFNNEILNFIDQVLNKEKIDSLSDDRFISRDEAELKYLRLINSTISMTSHLLQLSIKLDKMDLNLESSFNDLFNYENLWHYLLINSNTNNQRIFKTLLSLINAVLKLKPDLFNEKAWKLLSKRFLKSLTFVKKIDLDNSSNFLIYSTVILPILSTLINLNNSNPLFYSFDKSSKEKIIELLKVGSLNSDSSYYVKLSEYLKTSNILSLQDDSKIIETILLNDFRFELSKNLKFREGSNFIINSLLTNLEIISLSSNSNDSFQGIFNEVVKIKSPIINNLIDPIVKFIPNEIISSKFDSIENEDLNLQILLKISLLKTVSLESVLEKSLESLRSKSEEDEEGKSFMNHPAFEIFEFVIIENQSTYSQIINEFIDELPTFITPLVIEKPIRILITYANSRLYEKDLFIETFDNFIIKLTMIDSKDKLLSRLDKFANKAELLSNSQELQSTVNEASSKYNFNDDSLFKSHLITNESVIELYNLAIQLNKIDEFLAYFFKNNSENNELFNYLITNTRLIEDNLWSNESNSDLHNKFDLFLNDELVKERYFQSLKSFIFKNGSDSNLISTINEKLTKYPDLINILFNYEELINSLVEMYGDKLDSRLSLGNPLETNIYILEVQDKSFQIEPIRSLLNYSIFLNDLSVPSSDSLLLYLGILSEIGSDYLFLSAEDKENEAILKFKDDLSNKLNSLIPDTIKFDQILNSLISGDQTSTFIDLLFNEENQVLNFYKSRILFSILNDLKSKQLGFNNSKIDLLNFEKFIKTNIRLKDNNKLLIFITIIFSITEFLNSSQFERLRNLIASELIGLKSSEILTNGLNKLTVLNNFLVNNENDESPLQPQRLNLIINEINKWIESDISFEENFSVLRIQIMKFLNLLLNFNELKSKENLIEITVKLLQDSIAFISIGEGENLEELKYISIKLYLLIKKEKLFDEKIINELDDELLEYYKSTEEVEKVNQCIILNDELINRFLNLISFKKLKPITNELIIKYFKLFSLENKRNLIKKIEILILLKQQDLVIEFELNKTEAESFKIDEIFINNVLNPPNLNEFIEHEEKYNELLINYLWNWRLILIHFKEISLDLRNLYIKQLESKELLTKFLTFLSNLILFEINDKEYLLNFSEDEIINYFYEDVLNLSLEIKNLGINLYYLILNYIGSLSINWFNNLKDRSFKAKFENFTIQYISPNLIKDKLNQFQKKIESFTSKDENLTIRINKLTNEIKVIYLIDEQNLEIIFKIPDNYPLKNIEILGVSRVGVKEQTWKSWLLSSQRIISVTNGEIEESLNFFLKNIKFHFKGFEECAICYSILHSDNSLPSKKCSTCENKFHAGCLYKWFKSSGGNTCPLCRSTFNFK